MGAYSATRHLPYTAKQLYELAADVGEYPGFVPLCQSARIWNETVNDNGIKEFEAALVVAYDKLSIREEFVSQVTADPHEFRVSSYADQGPVKKLTSNWIFADSPEHGGASVSYDVSFKMRSMALQFVLDAAFNMVVEKVMNAFEARAHQLYGEG